MISINPDIIERLPKGCHECPFAYYDEHNGATFYCGLSRWSVHKQRRQKVRHRGCGLIDPDYNEDEAEKPKRDPMPKQKTHQDEMNEIVAKAKEFASTLYQGDTEDDLPLEDADEMFGDVTGDGDGNEYTEEEVE